MSNASMIRARAYMFLFVYFLPHPILFYFLCFPKLRATGGIEKVPVYIY